MRLASGFDSDNEGNSHYDEVLVVLVVVSLVVIVVPIKMVLQPQWLSVGAIVTVMMDSDGGKVGGGGGGGDDVNYQDSQVLVVLMKTI